MEILPLTSPVDQLVYSTTRIEVDLVDGQSSVGTGFFMMFQPDPERSERLFPALVTNRHVIENGVAGRFLVHEAIVMDTKRQPSGGRFYSEMADFTQAWIPHPDPTVDLAGVPLGNMLRNLDAAGHPPYFMSIGENLIPSQEQLSRLSMVEEVVMVGYPQGLADEAHGFPLYRHGYTASHPSIDFDGRPWGALDIAVFGGSSGSPILTYATEEGPLFLGVLFGGPIYRAGGTTIDELPTNTVQQVSTPLLMSLGYYVKTTQLVGLREEMLSRLGILGR